MNLKIRLRWYKHEPPRLLVIGILEIYGKGEHIYLLSIGIWKLYFELWLE